MKKRENAEGDQREGGVGFSEGVALKRPRPSGHTQRPETEREKGVTKQVSVGRMFPANWTRWPIEPATCFQMAHQLRTFPVFLNGWKKLKEE